MTLGIICTVIIGLIAIWQNWRARFYRAGAIMLSSIAESQRVALERTAQKLERSGRAFMAIHEGMTKAQVAFNAGDSVAFMRALVDSLAKAEAISKEDQPAGEQRAAG